MHLTEHERLAIAQLVVIIDWIAEVSKLAPDGGVRLTAVNVRDLWRAAYALRPAVEEVVQDVERGEVVLFTGRAG